MEGEEDEQEPAVGPRQCHRREEIEKKCSRSHFKVVWLRRELAIAARPAIYGHGGGGGRVGAVGPR